MSLLDTIEPWEEFKRQWAIDGMPKDKQRLAEAAFNAGIGNVESLLSQCRKEALLEAVDRFAGRGILYGYTVADELRRMAEGEK